MRKKVLLLLCLCVLVFVYLSCGYTPVEPPSQDPSASPPAKTDFSGHSTDATLINSDVTAYQLNSDGTLGDAISKTVQTDEKGKFDLTVEYDGNFLAVQSQGGKYIDEATGTEVAMGENILELYMAVFTPGTALAKEVTSLTAFSAALTRYFLSKGVEPLTAVTDAKTAFQLLVGKIDIDDVYPYPMDSEIVDIETPAESHYYGAYLVGISQYAKTLSEKYGVTVTSIDVTKALVKDLETDGLNNGLAVDTPIYIDAAGTIPLAPFSLRWNIPLNALRFIHFGRNRSPWTLDTFFEFFRIVSINTGVMFDPQVNPRELRREDIIPSIGTISGNVPGCSSGTVKAYEYTESGVQGALLAEGNVGPEGTYTLSYENYSGYLLLEAENCQYFEWSRNEIVSNTTPFSALIETENGTVTKTGVNISFFSTLVQEYADALIQEPEYNSIQKAVAEERISRHFFGVNNDITSMTHLTPYNLDEFLYGNKNFEFDETYKYSLLLASISRLADNYSDYLTEDADNDPVYAAISEVSLTTADLLQKILEDTSDTAFDGKKSDETIYADGVPLSPYSLRHLLGRAALDIINQFNQASDLSSFTEKKGFLDNGLAVDTGEPFSSLDARPIDGKDTKMNFFRNDMTLISAGEYINETFELFVKGEDVSGIQEWGTVLEYEVNDSTLLIDDYSTRIPNPSDNSLFSIELDTTAEVENGDILYKITATDNEGNETTNTSFYLIADNTPPSISFNWPMIDDQQGVTLQGETVYTNQERINIHGSATDSASGLDEVFCEGETVPLFDNNASFICTKDLNNGENSIPFSAKDKVGNQSPDKNLTVVRDTIAPSLSFNNATYSNGGSVDLGTFEFRTTELRSGACNIELKVVPEDAGGLQSGSFKYEYFGEVRDMPGDNKICVNTSYLTSSQLVNVVGESSHQDTIKFTVKDNMGNESTLSVRFRILQDTNYRTASFEEIDPYLRITDNQKCKRYGSEWYSTKADYIRIWCGENGSQNTFEKRCGIPPNCGYPANSCGLWIFHERRVHCEGYDFW